MSLPSGMSTTGSSTLRRCGLNLQAFTFAQHDQDLAEQQTEEAFAGASVRPVVNAADWLPLSLVNLA